MPGTEKKYPPRKILSFSRANKSCHQKPLSGEYEFDILNDDFKKLSLSEYGSKYITLQWYQWLVWVISSAKKNPSRKILSHSREINRATKSRSRLNMNKWRTPTCDPPLLYLLILESARLQPSAIQLSRSYIAIYYHAATQLSTITQLSIIIRQL